MKPATVHPEADLELLEAMDWYDTRQAGLGKELMEEVQDAIRRIEHDPGVGARYRNTPIRFYRLKRFPYVIYYQEMADGVWIGAIAHARRRQGYWKKRRPEQPG